MANDGVSSLWRILAAVDGRGVLELMVELGRQSPESPTSLKAIAEAEGLPLAYLEQVVARLRKAQPNGPECPPICFQASLLLSRGGALTELRR